MAAAVVAAAVGEDTPTGTITKAAITTPVTIPGMTTYGLDIVVKLDAFGACRAVARAVRSRFLEQRLSCPTREASKLQHLFARRTEY